MKLDPKELASVAAASAPRVDMYSGIHKALRALMADTLLAVGRMDADDGLERAQVTERVLELLQFCAGHLQHENEFVHAAIEARAPGASAQIGHEHEHNYRTCVDRIVVPAAALDRELARLAASAGAVSAVPGRSAPPPS